MTPDRLPLAIATPCRYAEVLLPVPLTGTFTYSVPAGLEGEVRPGSRVIVPFGRKKYYTGIVCRVHNVAPEGFQVKPVAMSIDGGEPIVRHPQLRLWEWLADYYLCSAGDIYRAAVPAGLKLESETFIELNPEYSEISEGSDTSDTSEPSELSEREAIVMQALDHAGKRVTVADVEKATGLKGVTAIISKLLLRGAVIISERLVERYTVRTESCVRIAAEPGDMEALRAYFDLTARAPKQQTVLQTLAALSGYTRPDGERREVTRAELAERSAIPSSIITALAKRGVVEVYKRVVDRFRYTGSAAEGLPTLTPAQSRALEEVRRSWLSKTVTLLHGVTSSGKTEIYMHLIDEALRLHRQTLLLVPEIALTTQLAHRLQKVFGDKVLVYHSKFSDNGRVDLWRRMLADPGPRVVLGARSSVFLPFGPLGLVIVDEEHESSYKQTEPSPRYNARDAAIVLATMHGAKVLLGSATPSVETYYKATEGGRFGLVTLTERYGGATLPAVETVDLSRERRVEGSSLAPSTRRLLADTLARGRQSILFINRRGYAPIARCRVCAHIPKCHNCDVSMTYHRSRRQLVCHYCGATQPLPVVCPACKEPAMEVVGYGSERVEDEVALALPGARVARMDLDTTRSKDAYETLIEDFGARRSDVLVGTQMVTKGLDFDGVDTVCVVSADAVLNYPDYRSDERAFCMIEQVAGRAGRRADNPGLVTVQTYTPDHPVLARVKEHDYVGFYNDAIAERRRYFYPPFVRLVHIHLKHRDHGVCAELASLYAERLRALLGARVQGPEEPPVARIQSLYIRRIMLKIEPEASMAKVRALLIEQRDALHGADPRMKGAQLHYDVDPC